MIELSHVYKSFGKKEVLHDISFSLQKGVTAFLGTNGAGKTTTMNIITGVIAPDSGKILINNLDLSENSIEIKRKIGYLPENNPIYDTMYVAEYLRYVAEIYLPQERVKQSIEKIIDQTDLGNEVKRKIGTLSYGNKQRVGLAQALVHDPDILILDEPSNGLDPIQQIKINNLLTELGKSKTILFSSHRLEDVADIASHYLILQNGRLILDDKIKNITSLKEFFFQAAHENNSR